MGFDEIERRLTVEGRELLLQMVDLHTVADPRSQRAFHFVMTGAGARLIWPNDGVVTAPVSSSILNDLLELQLLRVDRSWRDPRYEVRADTIRFAAELRSQGGPVAAIEREVARLVDDSGFEHRHPAATHHLREAQQLLWSETATAEHTVIEIGNHLRSALQAVVHDVAGGRDPEEPIANLAPWAATLAEDRESALLIEVARYTLKCCNRLTHIRNDVTGKGRRPIRSLDEIRRTVFLTTVACNEIDALAREATSE